MFETRPQFGREGGWRLEREVHTGATRAAGVDQQRADPMLGVGGEVARWRVRARSMVAPWGRFQLTGTLMVAHSNVAESLSPEGGSQGVQAMRPGDVCTDGAATAVPASNWPNSAVASAPTASRLRVLARGDSGGLDGTGVPP
jgi:hypothetical protein